MLKLDLEKAEEPEIKLPTSTESLKNQEVPEKHLFLLYWLHQSLWLCGLQQTGKFLKRWEYQTNLSVSWVTCMQVKKQQLEPDRLVQNWARSTSQLYIVTLLFNLDAEYIMWNARLDEAQAGIKIAERIINNLRYTDNTTFMPESEEELKSLLMRVKEESENAGLKLNVQKTKIVPSLHGK